MSINNPLQRKIAVVTGTRAEYGLLKGLLDEIKLDSNLQLQLIVTAMHLSPEFGLTYQLIEQDGFKIDAKVEMLLSSDTNGGIAKSVAVGVFGFTDAFERLNPDMIVILGDRFEAFSAAQAALFLKIPIAHIHGGELSFGAIDEQIRHCITKMAHLHFTAADSYRQRVIQLGEQPEFVFNTGSPGIERLKKAVYLNQDQLEKSLSIQFKNTTFLVNYHPAALELNTLKQDIESLFLALDLFPDAQILMTKSNADASGRLFNQLIDQYTEKQNGRVKVFMNLGEQYYPSVMRLVDVMIGNSSSGIIEAPSLSIPTVNIGSRQDGRLRAASVIDCDHHAESIQVAIKKALSPEFRDIVKSTVSPYDCDETAFRIKEILKKIALKSLSKKIFCDAEVHEKPTCNHHC